MITYIYNEFIFNNCKQIFFLTFFHKLKQNGTVIMIKMKEWILGYKLQIIDV
jgi:hypothetical protein